MARGESHRSRGADPEQDTVYPTKVRRWSGSDNALHGFDRPAERRAAATVTIANFYAPLIWSCFNSKPLPLGGNNMVKRHPCSIGLAFFSRKSYSAYRIESSVLIRLFSNI